MNKKVWIFILGLAVVACQENNSKGYFLGIPIPGVNKKIVDTLNTSNDSSLSTNLSKFISSDSLFFVSQDTISYVVLYELDVNNDYQVKLSIPNHTIHFRVKPELFYNIVNPAFHHQLAISKPEIFKYIPKYKQTIFWFDLGIKTKESSGIGMIAVDSLGQVWDTSFVSYDGIERFRYCFSPDTEVVLLGNHLIEFQDKRKIILKSGPVFSAFLNNQVFCTVYDPMITDTIQQEQYVKSNGDTVMKYYYETRRDTKKNNVFIQNLAGDTLTKFRYDGICQNQMFQKQILFTRMPEQNLSIFVDPQNQQTRIIDNLLTSSKTYPFKQLDYPPSNFYSYFDMDTQCHLKPSKGILRFFLDSNNKFLGYIKQD